MSESSQLTLSNNLVRVLIEKIPTVAINYALEYSAAALAVLTTFCRRTGSDPWIIVTATSGSLLVGLYILTSFLSWIRTILYVFLIIGGGGSVVRRLPNDWINLALPNRAENGVVEGDTKKHIEELEGFAYHLRDQKRE